jgi:hypothetical protein
VRRSKRPLCSRRQCFRFFKQALAAWPGGSLNLRRCAAMARPWARPAPCPDRILAPFTGGTNPGSVPRSGDLSFAIPQIGVANFLFSIKKTAQPAPCRLNPNGSFFALICESAYSAAPIFQKSSHFSARPAQCVPAPPGGTRTGTASSGSSSSPAAGYTAAP